MKKKILIFTNDFKNVINLRIDLINFLKKYYQVKILIIDKKNKNLKNLYSLNKDYKSFNIFKDLFLLNFIYKFIKKNKPDLIINFTLKPSIYGTLISYLLGIKSITVVTGLGSVYLNILTKLFYTTVMKQIFNLNSLVVFQNKSDQKIFYKNHNNKTKIIPGSGFDKNKFRFKKKKINENNFKFLMVSRLLKDKGVFEFLESAKYLKKKFDKKIDFYFMFSSDESFFSFPKKKMYTYNNFVKFLEFSKKKYINYLNLADCFVLPSYREGFSKTLLEASSMGKIILTTNVPGCRDIIVNKKTGFLCLAKSINSLTNFMNDIYLLNRIKRNKISLEASKRVNKKFSCNEINKNYLSVIRKLI